MKKPLKIRLEMLASLTVWVLMTGLIAACLVPGRRDVHTLPEEPGFLQIPGVGWQTFNRTADMDKTLGSLRFKSGCAYYRFYWKKLEPEEGQFAFGMIDSLLKRCRANNQTFAFRIMCEDPWGEGLPQWLIDKGIKRTYTPCPQEGAHYSPDMSDSLFRFYHQRLVMAFGQRYDGHPDLALVDIGSVGLWGEWHIYCDPGLMPGREIRKEVTDLYFEAFPETPLTALVGDIENLEYAVDRGRCGWRGDSWGDAAAPGKDWNHHEARYWPAHNHLPEAWKTGTVAMEPGEPGGTLKGLLAPINKVVDDAISWHVTFAQNKSREIPQEYIPEIERLVMNMGFRLVLHDFSYRARVKRGSEITVTMNWENLGIAPPYRDHRIAFRIKNRTGETKAVEISNISIQGWLPGEKSVTVKYRLPDELDKDGYILEMGVVYHRSVEHTIPVANKGKTDDGWYPLGKLKVY